ncbi:MAG TPA: amidohydrolase [Rhodospirillaceae bacterium]|nr:amidohydrolase [Alphaproteobacteria bacterium]OUT41388.1 MAG: hypothetical protein CBB62_03310 [Micavibrio sp. TMED2]HCI46019.1 amidohydrolase [Rhodospirillaceae bacterium]MAS47070.1 amidohydrolase [Alphaproteobacteria bacterium]MAX95164.1 amidohydrolase [Alphaproteobacteria bacterium]|tara:strand:- start:1446 stop:2258 length:813 start_codon:yes stop_codon:yes gene_type:complete
MIDVACVQLNVGEELGPNLDHASELIAAAASTLPASDNRLIATPEMTSGIVKGRERALAAALPMAEHPAIIRFSEQAASCRSWLLIGSISVKLENDERLANRSLLFNPDGELVAQYDKQHMFDVDVTGDQVYCESNTYRPGDKTVSADIGAATLGLSICYDVRFPALYRALARAGAGVIAVPAAFTVPTGKAHWSVLLRARAIETGSFIVAPGQTGEHHPGRVTYGHSMIISPWGEVLAEADDQPGVISATLDLALVDKARKAVPAWQFD